MQLLFYKSDLQGPGFVNESRRWYFPYEELVIYEDFKKQNGNIGFLRRGVFDGEGEEDGFHLEQAKRVNNYEFEDASAERKTIEGYLNEVFYAIKRAEIESYTDEARQYHSFLSNAKNYAEYERQLVKGTNELLKTMLK
jgi:hypothetical protein